MARGEYCAEHGVFYGNVVPCPGCVERRRKCELDQLEALTYEQWLHWWRFARFEPRV